VATAGGGGGHELHGIAAREEWHGAAAKEDEAAGGCAGMLGEPRPERSGAIVDVHRGAGGCEQPLVAIR
jgi:hypothetical protein